MPLIIETEDGQTFGPGQPYGYQGQYQGQRQPGLETANMRSVPERLQSLPQRPPGQPSSGRHMGYGGGPQRPPGQPISGPHMGYGGGPTRPPGQPSFGRHMGYGGDRGIFAGRNAGPANDTVSAILGGMGRGQEEGFGDVAGKTTDDRVVEKLWGKAVNSLPVGTPDLQIQQEWERLKKIYFDSKYRT